MFIFSGRKIARNVMAMATGEAPAEVATTEPPELVKTLQEAVSQTLAFSPPFIKEVKEKLFKHVCFFYAELEKDGVFFT